MRIATLQFAPKLGDVEGNINKADQLLRRGKAISSGGIVPVTIGIDQLRPDILVLPELAFTGYNFPSLESITPYLEPVGEGPTAKWARKTARQLGCKVCVGYPEIEQISSEEPPKRYNSLLVVDERGEIILNYRKTFLYYTDESWAMEGDVKRGFHRLVFRPQDAQYVSSLLQSQSQKLQVSSVELSEDDRDPARESSGILRQDTGVPVVTRQIATSFGICMDINPYKFEAPFTAWEFANRVLDSKSQLVIISMAWLTLLSKEELEDLAHRPEMDTFHYWIRRFWPLIEKRMNRVENIDGEDGMNITVVFANRAGEEHGEVTVGSPPARYAGTSAIVTFTQRRRSPSAEGANHAPATTKERPVTAPLDLSDVKILCWDIMGATDENICFGDTTAGPKMMFTVLPGRHREGE